MTQPLQHHLAYLSPLRMIIIILIGLGYVSTLPYGPHSTEVLHFLGYDPSWYGVSLLFFLSGFLAHKSLGQHGSIIAFLRSRITRNLPVLMVFCLLVVGVLYPIFGVAQLDPSGQEISGQQILGQKFRYVLSVLSGMDGNAPTPGLLDHAKYPNLIQGSLWTFRWGVIAYVLTCLLWWAGPFKNKFSIFCFAMVTMIIYGVFSGMQFYIADPSPAKKFIATGLRLGWIYLLGMSVYGYRRSMPPFLVGRKLLFWACAFIILAAVLYRFYPWTSAIEVAVTLGFACLCSLIILAGNGEVKSTARLPGLLSGLPDLSLGLYVFIWPVAQIILLHFPSLAVAPLFMAALLFSIVISLVLYGLVQRPLQNRKRSTP